MKYVRIILAAFSSEILAIISLVAAVAVFGPSDPEGAQSFAQEAGIWLGPTAGFVFTLLVAWFVARKMESGQIQTGAAIGVATAAIDVLLLIVGGSGFKLIFVLSNLGRVAAGCIGGWLASR